MTTTLSNMIDEVLINLSGYTYAQDRATYLKTAVTTTTSSSADPTILTLGSTENVGKGTLEVDEELMWVDSFDRISNTATISPYGRGYLGTTAATHALDAKVTISPTFPRHSIKRAINEVKSGHRYLGSLLSENAIDAYVRKSQSIQIDSYEALTTREREILGLICEGNTGGQIAERLSLSVRTVEMHRANFMNKLGLHSQVDIVRFAIKRGLISPDTL